MGFLNKMMQATFDAEEIEVNEIIEDSYDHHLQGKLKRNAMVYGIQLLFQSNEDIPIRSTVTSILSLPSERRTKVGIANLIKSDEKYKKAEEPLYFDFDEDCTVDKNLLKNDRELYDLFIEGLHVGSLGFFGIDTLEHALEKNGGLDNLDETIEGLKVLIPDFEILKTAFIQEQQKEKEQIKI